MLLLLLLVTIARMVRIMLAANVVIAVDMVMRAKNAVRDEWTAIVVAACRACG